MKVKNIGGHASVNAYVSAKTEKMKALPPTFAALFELMFSERENILWEESRGYRIVKTAYGEARAAALGYAAALREPLQSLPGNALVGLALPNGVQWIELLWAVLAAGYRPVLLNVRLGAPVLSAVLAENGIQTVIAAAGELPEGCVVPLTIAAESLVPLPGAEVPAEFGTEILVMSSGTSSHVKCCAYGAEQIRTQILDSSRIIRECGQIKKHYQGEMKLLAILPLCHIFGLSAMYFWFAFFSRTFVGLSDLSPKTVQNTVRRHKVTHIFAVPLFWEKTYDAAMRGIRERGEKTEKKFEKGMRISAALDFCPPLGDLFGKLAFRALREEIFGDSICFLISGGSGISPLVLNFFNRIGYRLANGYGMSEVGITSVELSGNIGLLSVGTVGKPFSSVKYLRDESGKLLVGGPARAKYVITDGKKTELPEYYETQDLCEVEPRSGSWRILGRSDDLVIGKNGENLNPEVLEPFFVSCGANGVCLCAVPAETGVQSLLLLSVNRYLTEEACRAVQKNAEEVMALLHLTGQIDRTVLTFAPLLEQGDFKLNRRRVAERYAAGELPPVSFSAETFEARNAELLGKIRAAFRLALNRQEEFADTADFFSDLGGTSFDWYGMISGLGETLGVDYPKNPAGLATVREIYIFTEEYFEKTVD